MKSNSIMSEERMTSGQITLTAVMAAFICVLGPLSIPIPVSPVPISFTNLAVYITVCLLGWKLGALSYLIYLMIGLSGLPVFSGFSCGFGKLLGPTGGYLIGFFFMAIICGLSFEKFSGPVGQGLGLILGSAVNYIFGTVWLCYVAHLTFIQGLWAGVIPYIPGDLIKIIIAVITGPLIKKRLTAAGLFGN